ncbi:SPARC-related modular calcium-binding protein 2 [Musca vetustissima]|uniref:SPARC-related modular calcium-binding protein 2 n=1 Tax=Musca vetustissima TaxID=27455 RepID=UPI002AB62052|nr:SPARC-related modular calcium-binding protein 2 [Musca vetustissima]
MILRSILLFVICMRFASAGNVKRPDLTISECAAKLGECDESKGRPVCGTDDQTYPTRCHLLRVQCSGHQVSLKYRGPCKACAEAREYALRNRNKYPPPKFIPRCKPDGTYAPIQCLLDKGCWCSDSLGSPINNTSVRTGKPKCREFTKANVRRSPSRNNGGNRKRPCTQEDRATFNSHLIRVFQSEYIRSKSTQYHQRDMGGGGANRKSPLDTFSPPSDTEVMDWKFSHLDVNRNQMLDKNEYRELKKLVKRAVKPKRCGRAFGKFCDVDSDERLSRVEWNSCLAKDGSNRPSIFYQQQHHHSTSTSSQQQPPQHHHHHINNNNIPHHHNNNNNNHQNRLRPDSYEDNESNAAADNDDDSSSQHLDYEDGDDYEDSDDDGSSTKFPSIYILKPPTEIATKESDIESDCLADQAAALEEKKHANNLYYVPDCTPDGRYQRIQCYNSTPYCWCVNEDTGKTIEGTFTHLRPQCDSFYAVTRAMKGCPEERKVIFLKDLKEFLRTKIITGSYAGVNTTNWSSEDERIATLSFVILDKNKSSAWEKKEWKTFRELMNTVNNLRKCGRKMPRYCDVNGDKKITLNEWISCLQTSRMEITTGGGGGARNDVKQQNTSISDKNSSKTPKLSGSNPLEQYLKD